MNQKESALNAQQENTETILHLLLAYLALLTRSPQSDRQAVLHAVSDALNARRLVLALYAIQASNLLTESAKHALTEKYHH